MRETETTLVSASIASTGKGIRYIGNYAYAYSGVIGVADSTVELLNFTTGAGILKTHTQFFYAEDSRDSEDIRYRVKLNGAVVQQGIIGVSDFEAWVYGFLLIIPPFTEVICDALNVVSSSTRNQAVTITGRIYGAE